MLLPPTVRLVHETCLASIFPAAVPATKSMTVPRFRNRQAMVSLIGYGVGIMTMSIACVVFDAVIGAVILDV